jgi:hypothetical protein
VKHMRDGKLGTRFIDESWRNKVGDERFAAAMRSIHIPPRDAMAKLRDWEFYAAIGSVLGAEPPSITGSTMRAAIDCVLKEHSFERTIWRSRGSPWRALGIGENNIARERYEIAFAVAIMVGDWPPKE